MAEKKSLYKYKLGDLIESCHTDLFVPNGTHVKKAKVVRPEPIRVTKKGIGYDIE